MYGKEIEIVNRYKYLGVHSNNEIVKCLCLQRFCQQGQREILDLMRTMWSLGSFDTTVFFQLFDAQIKPMLLYASEVWGTSMLANIETAHLFACKRLLSVSDKTPNYIVYGETGGYPLYIDITVSSLRYWFKLSKMPMTRFPKQALVMLKNRLDTNTTHKNRNWAGSIKDCLESYGFQDVWTNGRVENEKAFLSAFKQRMTERFKQEWFTKISESERFSTYFSFKSVHQLETYLNAITIKKFRDTLIRLRLGINNLGVNKRFLCDSFVNKNCPFCPDILEDESHFLFCCPAYDDVRRKYLSHIIVPDTAFSLNSVFDNASIEQLRKFAMFAFYALKHREELLAQ